jgi:hypothetical protein
MFKNNLSAHVTMVEFLLNYTGNWTILAWARTYFFQTTAGLQASSKQHSTANKYKNILERLGRLMEIWAIGLPKMQ